MPPDSVSPRDKQGRVGECRGSTDPGGWSCGYPGQGEACHPVPRLLQDKQSLCPRGQTPLLPPRIAALRPLQLAQDAGNCVHPVLTPGAVTLSPTIFSRSVPIHICTVKLARKEKESSLSGSKLLSPSSAASSRKAEAAC